MSNEPTQFKDYFDVALAKRLAKLIGDVYHLNDMDFELQV